MRVRYQTVYQCLFDSYGRQNWWPGETPFEVMVGAILTQNTAWSNVEKAIANLIRADVLSPEAIVATHPRRLASWLKPSGYFNVKAKRLRAFCRWLIDRGGERYLEKTETEALRTELLRVHGIGPETADDILLYALGRPVFVIDAYTRRIFSRLGLITGKENYEDLRQKFEHTLPTDVDLYNEYHALIVIHGKDICRRRPLCQTCCLQSRCTFFQVS